MIRKKTPGSQPESFKQSPLYTLTVGGVVIFLIAFFQSCINEKPKSDVQPCNNKIISFANDVKPILIKSCYSCHDNRNHFGGCKLEDFTDVQNWVSSGELQYSIYYDTDNIPIPKMPKGGKLSECDITVINNWVNQGAENN
ncbi:MAG: hypothetical protein U0X91_28580 [Spirosomataceae bacterium]